MHSWVHVCACTCVYVCMHSCMCVCARGHVYMHVGMRLYVCFDVMHVMHVCGGHANMHAYIHACVYACMWACICMYVLAWCMRCMYVASTRTCMNNMHSMHAYACMFVYMYVRHAIYVCCVCTYKTMYIFQQGCMYMHARILYMYVHAGLVCMYVHVWVCMSV
jgi:hypothetical protein